MKYILSIDGGGVKVYIALYFLLCLEKDLGKSIYDTFDFYIGNSAGAMLTGSIAYLGKDMSVSELVNTMYTHENIKKIFTKNTSMLAKLSLRPKYCGKNKTDLLRKYLGEKNITDTPKKIIFPVYSVSEQIPKFYKSYSFEEFGEKETNLVCDVIDGSSAAPGFFPSVTSGTNTWIDGGVFANNPCDCGYADAIRMYPGEDITILSLGAGSHINVDRFEETEKYGAIGWAMSGIGNIILNTGQCITDYRMTQFTKILGHKYLRIQYPSNISLDDTSKLDELEELGRKWYTINKEQVLQLLNII